ncbi:MAG: trypsin-like peptidase domain-containing protein [archaeon]|nr:MAG: trypsin-like peptidase domain-containing protein [archaeon]
MKFLDTDHIAASTVKVVNRKGQGSAIVLDSSCYVATCAHVVPHRLEGLVNWYGHEDAEEEYEVVAYDKEADTAILKVDPSFRKYLGMGGPTPSLRFLTSRKSIELGTVVAACGYPWITPREEDEGILTHPPTVTLGVISLWRSKGQPIMLSALLHRGNSGGPVFNEHGIVMGIASQSLLYEESEPGSSMSLPLGYGEMIPMSMISKLASDSGIRLQWKQV